MGGRQKTTLFSTSKREEENKGKKK